MKTLFQSESCAVFFNYIALNALVVDLYYLFITAENNRVLINLITIPHHLPDLPNGRLSQKDSCGVVKIVLKNQHRCMHKVNNCRMTSK